MAGGGHVGPTGVAKERADKYQGRVTLFVVIACLVAAVGGSIFGYDIGISGTVFVFMISLNLNLEKDAEFWILFLIMIR